MESLKIGIATLCSPICISLIIGAARRAESSKIPPIGGLVRSAETMASQLKKWSAVEDSI